MGGGRYCGLFTILSVPSSLRLRNPARNTSLWRLTKSSAVAKMTRDASRPSAISFISATTKFCFAVLSVTLGPDWKLFLQNFLNFDSVSLKTSIRHLRRHHRSSRVRYYSRLNSATLHEVMPESCLNRLSFTQRLTPWPKSENFMKNFRITFNSNIKGPY